MKHHVTSIFWIETALATVAALFAMATGLCLDWVERVFSVDPDGHSGSIDWKILVGFVLTAAFFAAAAHRNWRKSLIAI